ncbi:hypothetical protein KKE45_00800 [Patescibacteria group bacterium]|nr:hypothetical protein [Patescibacteria group bacterium]
MREIFIKFIFVTFCHPAVVGSRWDVNHVFYTSDGIATSPPVGGSLQ